MKKLELKIFNVSLPAEVLKDFDELADSMHWGRSTLIRLAVEYFIQTHYLVAPKPKPRKGVKVPKP